jgi:uncharacterized membrane-anchored protein
MKNPEKKLNNNSLTNQDDKEKTIVLKPKAIKTWRFLLPLIFQLSLLAFLPATAINTYLTGKTVILQTAPVDPYSLLTGYHQVLSYEISRPNNLSNLEGWQELKKITCSRMRSCPNSSYSLPQGTKVYVVLQKPLQQNKVNFSDKLQPWQATRVSYKYPQNLQSSEIALQGKYRNGRIQYGLESYYLPEAQKEKINQDINQANMNLLAGERIPFLVETKVNSQGQAIPISLWIKEQNYRF